MLSIFTISKPFKEFSFKVKMNFEEGLKMTIEWYRESNIKYRDNIKIFHTKNYNKF